MPLATELTLGASPKPPGVDESLIRQQLELTPAQRLGQLEAMAHEARVLMLAGARARGELRLTSAPTALLIDLADGEVDFVVIGGVAVVLQAQPRFTKDLDICYATDPANLERLGGVLIGLNARLRGVDDDIPFVADARMLRQTQILALTTDDGDLDLLRRPVRRAALCRAARATPTSSRSRGSRCASRRSSI